MDKYKRWPSIDTGKATIMLITFPAIPSTIISKNGGFEAQYYVPSDGRCMKLWCSGAEHVNSLFDMGDKDWKNLVKYIGHPWDGYKDYTNDKNWFSSAKVSASSLFQSLDMVDKIKAIIPEDLRGAWQHLTHVFIINNK